MPRIQKCCLMGFCAILCYVLSYHLLMDPKVFAVDPGTNRYFPTSCRLSSWVRIPGDLSIYCRKANLCNFPYLPLDWAHGRTQQLRTLQKKLFRNRQNKRIEE
jgi:hypothetical protein